MAFAMPFGKDKRGQARQVKSMRMEQFRIPGSIGEARAIQEEFRREVGEEPGVPSTNPSLVAGADASYGSASAYASVVLMKFPSLAFCSRAEARSGIQYPYVPGYFSFREIPPLLEAFSLLGRFPDLVMVHGHGYAHPRRTGLATHLGYHLQIPSIGIAGSGMKGMDAREPSLLQGSATPVWMDGEMVGTLLRTREGSAAVYVSAGYRTTLDQAREIVMQCIRANRFPEPLVQADRATRRMRNRCER